MELYHSRILAVIAGPFSRTAVNFNAGCKSAVSNIVMAIAVMFTLLFLTPLFHYTPLVVLSSIIISAMLGLLDYEAAIHLWKIDKFDFFICLGAYLGVVLGSVEIGLVIAVSRVKSCQVISLYKVRHMKSLIQLLSTNADHYFLAKDSSIRGEASNDCSRQYSKLWYL